MATSEVEIWNYALARAKSARRIGGVNEQSAEAKLLRTVYGLTLARLLEAYDWDFARRYGSLTPLGESELQNGWSYAYEWPAGAIAFRAILNPSAMADEKGLPFEIAVRTDSQSRKIMCNETVAVGKWTLEITDVSRFTASFTNALAYALGVEVAVALSSDSESRRQAKALEVEAKDVALVASASGGRSRLAGDSYVPPAIRARA